MYGFGSGISWVCLVLSLLFYGRSVQEGWGNYSWKGRASDAVINETRKYL